MYGGYNDAQYHMQHAAGLKKNTKTSQKLLSIFGTSLHPLYHYSVSNKQVELILGLVQEEEEQGNKQLLDEISK